MSLWGGGRGQGAGGGGGGRARVRGEVLQCSFRSADTDEAEDNYVEANSKLF